MSYVSTVLADSPVSYWQLSEGGGTAADSADSNPGAYYGVSSQSSSYPLTPCSVFSGLTPYVDVLDAPNLLLTNVTMEAWIKTTHSDSRVILSKYSASPSGWALAVGVVTAGKLNLWPGLGSWVDGTINVSDGNWHHVVGSISSAGLVNTYVDSQLDTSITVSKLLPTTARLVIGAASTSGAFFNGSLMHVAVYPYVLSQSQINNHFASVGDVGAIRNTQLPIRIIRPTENPTLRDTQLPVRTILQPYNNIRACQVAVRILQTNVPDVPFCIPIRKGFNNRSVAPITPT